MMGASTRKGEEIAEKSRKIIKKLIRDKIEGLSPEESAIIERIVHSTADPEYADITKMSQDFIPSTIDALWGLKDILVDVEMVKVGISYDGEVKCYINHPSVIRMAKDKNMTRAAAAMEYAASKGFSGVVVVGNAPTALLKLIKLAKAGMDVNSIIGVPVGFVGAAESKKLLTKTDIPYLITSGPKGGTPVAVAATNALINLAKKRGGII
ncbi:cobalt-precorrin-8 methylmutase [Methanothermobacter tenebrarum]|uniref:Precorrin-8X methylmutase n=1 Tax=Methanothermobacter tenebrarum TaxID=680118 RepID=A0A328PC66_9EURY|nr:cobalt-precorrin-8 methylmutase [Methanothermobacter tenebrarum]MBC7101301.1 cobalt-precorrin-8 methylmutase [Methanobacteriales archaeon]MBC7118615.1 cobalt-precorrin-8 methylmutase [Methanobacteriaceae archaeon]NPV64542.1 cobalt-precorrin-8 methylmutase [Methanobacteriaceae archaeon]RAO78773.1 precorrin-8X methylmutase [Methanothermobacter tenebrarum]